MPVNPLNGIFSRIWKFVDQFAADDEITRSTLDAALDDFTPAINSALGAQRDAARIAENVGVSFDTLARLQSDITLTYATGSNGTVSIGQLITIRDVTDVYEVADATATDADITTAGGIKLYRINNATELAGWGVDEALRYIADLNQVEALKSGLYYFDADTLNNPFASKIAEPGFNRGYVEVRALLGGAKMIDVMSENGKNHVRKTVTSSSGGVALPWGDFVYFRPTTLSPSEIPNGSLIARDGGEWVYRPPFLLSSVSTPTRLALVSYQNTTTSFRMVAIRGTAGSATPIEISPNGTVWFTLGLLGASDDVAFFLVPPDFYYRVNGGTATITSWVEVG